MMIIAGESSGDLHGAHLARALQELRPDLKLFGFGGSEMSQAGVEILYDPTRIAVIGAIEVLRHLSDFRKMYAQAIQALDERKPNLVVLIDYPGFNLRFAEEVKRRGIRLVYYISPQVWAWGRGRIPKIRRLVDRMLVVFSFEKELYEKEGIPVTFVGHPLLDLVKPTLTRMEALEHLGLEDGMPIVGLLPGSREVEVSRILPALLKAGEKMRERLPSTARFLLIKAPHLPWEIYRRCLNRSSLAPKVVERWDYNSIFACDLVLVASGTATLECALLERPMLIVYKTSWPTYLISRAVITLPYIGLVTVVAGEKFVPEFIQHRATPAAIANCALELWGSADKREKMRATYKKIRESLGSPGAAPKAAGAILTELSSLTS
jgi:lipid-A-disaccharide synthase